MRVKLLSVICPTRYTADVGERGRHWKIRLGPGGLISPLLVCCAARETGLAAHKMIVAPRSSCSFALRGIDLCGETYL